MRRGWICCISLFAMVAQAHVALADEINEDPLPKSEVLSCGMQCVNFTPAKPLKHEILEFPRSEIGAFKVTNSEGFVWFLYTVGVDGRTHDISQIYGLGNPEFSRRTIETVKNWTFEPAMSNGKPVPQSKTFTADFSVPIPEPIRPAILDDYKKANALFDGGKTDEALAVLREDLALSRLSLLERSMLALPLAKIAMARKDYLEARRYALMATRVKRNLITPSIESGLWETLITADLMLGEISDALNAFNALTLVSGFNTESPYVNLIKNARAHVDATPQLVAQARIPLEGTEGLVYWHDLYRRTFSFAAVTGSLDRYVLNCDQSMSESKISLSAEWHVPAGWSNCMIFVYGAPGTTFRIVETNDDKQQQSQVMAHYDDAIRAEPNNALRWLARARAYKQAGRLPDAMSDYSKAIELNAGLGIAYLERTRIDLTMNNIAAATADSETALRLEPKNTDAIFLHATVQRQNGKYQEALAELNGLISGEQKDLNVKTVYINRAITQFALGKYAEAEVDFLKSIANLDRDLYVYNWLHVVRTKRGMDDDPLYAILRSGLPEASWIREIAGLYRGRQSVEQAEVTMKAQRVHPVLEGNWPCAAEFYLGEYKLAHGDIAGARAEFGAISPANCDYGEAAAAVAELKRLPAN